MHLTTYWHRLVHATVWGHARPRLLPSPGTEKTNTEGRRKMVWEFGFGWLQLLPHALWYPSPSKALCMTGVLEHKPLLSLLALHGICRSSMRTELASHVIDAPQVDVILGSLPPSLQLHLPRSRRPTDCQCPQRQWLF